MHLTLKGCVVNGSAESFAPEPFDPELMAEGLMTEGLVAGLLCCSSASGGLRFFVSSRLELRPDLKFYNHFSVLQYLKPETFNPLCAMRFAQTRNP